MNAPLGTVDQQVLIGIGEIKGRLDGFLITQATHKEAIDAHDKRIGALERWRAYTLGICASLVFAADFLLRKVL